MIASAEVQWLRSFSPEERHDAALCHVSAYRASQSLKGKIVALTEELLCRMESVCPLEANGTMLFALYTAVVYGATFVRTPAVPDVIGSTGEVIEQAALREGSLYIPVLGLSEYQEISLGHKANVSQPI